MKILLTRYVGLLIKIGIALGVLWSIVTLTMFWFSGAEETKKALATGERFIIHIEDGKVEGAAPSAPEVKQAEAMPEQPASPASEEKKADAATEKPVPPSPANEPPPAALEEVDVPAVTASSNPIVDVSDDLLDKSTGVPLPKISESGMKPWQFYAKKFRRQNELPMIAIVVTGLGHSKHSMELALALDDRIGLSFSPYASAIANWTTSARLTGHEMYVDLPLQTTGYPTDDPGPNSILVARSNTENIKNLNWAMSRFQGYVGLVAPPSEVVTHTAEAFAPLRDEIAPHGLMMLMLNSVSAAPEKNKDKPPLITMNADVWIDEELSEMSIQARLATLEQVAQRTGSAIGIVRSYPLSLNQVKLWQETLGSRGIVIAPASFITKLKYP